MNVEFELNVPFVDSGAHSWRRVSILCPILDLTGDQVFNIVRDMLDAVIYTVEETRPLLRILSRWADGSPITMIWDVPRCPAGVVAGTTVRVDFKDGVVSVAGACMPMCTIRDGTDKDMFILGLEGLDESSV